MDTRLTSAVPHMPIATGRQDAAPVREAVRTELAAPVAVSAQVGAEQSRWNRDRRFAEAGMPKPRESSIETDRETGDLVYKVIDAETRATVAQYPYESLLKLRAYIKSTEEH
ncbi:MAG: hypothetical protein FD175_1592 [Beijerinckiaceae bacterium]|nr:MAG: hypothetical protein FD175_1592 [Beijerinckiaceae bacterium]